jgi:hypothetical protein
MALGKNNLVRQAIVQFSIRSLDREKLSLSSLTIHNGINPKSQMMIFSLYHLQIHSRGPST